MKHKYGEFTDNQFMDYGKRLHSMIHWLLVYSDNNEHERLDSYFEKVQYKLDGLNSVLNNPPEMVDLVTLIEAARVIHSVKEFNKAQYRKMILDAHEVVDRMIRTLTGGGSNGVRPSV